MTSRFPWLRHALSFLALAAGVNLAGAGKPPAPDFPKPANRTEANRQDLQYLRTAMRFDQSFSAEARAKFDAAVTELEARADRLDEAAFELGVARAVAFSDNGHSNARGISRGRALNSLPIRLNWFAEGLFVVKADPANADLLDAQVLQVGDQSIDAIVTAWRPYVGGPDILARAFVPNFVQSPQALHAAGLLPSPAEARLVFAKADGSRLERTLRAGPDSTNLPGRNDWPQRALSPVPIPTDSRPWVHSLDATKPLPVYLQQPDTPYWHVFLPELDAVYVQINTTRTRGDQPLDAFLAQVLAEVEKQKTRNAIIDLRFNSGGNYMLVNEFSERLPKAIPANGKIFLLTGPDTFSAAIVMVARLKFFAGNRGEIVGEPCGDREIFWAEGENITLPNSKISVRYSDGYHDWERGPNAPGPKQHAPNARYGVAAGKLTPTIPAPPRIADYLAGKDSAFEAIKHALAK